MPTTREQRPAEPKPDLAEIAIAISAGLGLAILALYLCLQPLSIPFASNRDFIVYWATGQQLVRHGNPYDLLSMAALEHAAGFPGEYTVGVMRNPPWSLFLTLPLGVMGVRMGAIFWSLLELACIWISARLLWILFGRQKPPVHWLAIAFGPTVLCVIMGQTSTFAMLGVILFFYLHERRPFWAGASLWLCLLKPHLFVLFWPVLLLWCLRRRRYSIALGAAAAMAAGLATLPLVAPQGLAQYMYMVRHVGMAKEAIPCLSIMLRLWTRPSADWIQSIPSALGCLWAIWYYWRRRQSWDWLRDGGLLLLVSAVAAPYCWLYDQGIALPALLDACYRTRSRIVVTLIAAASLACEILVASKLLIFSMVFFWAAPLWLALYLAAGMLPKKKEAEAEPCAECALDQGCAEAASTGSSSS